MDQKTEQAIEGNLAKAAQKIVKEQGVDISVAYRIAATEISGTGDQEGGTVLGVQTCYSTDKRRISGVTGRDSATPREDKFAGTEENRHNAAEEGKDAAAAWIRKYGSNK